MIIKSIRQAISASVINQTKLALIVRSDIKMSKGKTAAQCSHAAVLCYQRAQSSSNKKTILESWNFCGQPKIVLRIDSLDDMIQLEQKARQSNVIAEIVRDAGRTQLEPGTATVIGIGPDNLEMIDKLVSHLKLL